MIERRAVVRRAVGLHARPASELAKSASAATGRIWISRPDDDTPVDGKSLLQIMSLGVLRGDEVVLRASESQDGDTIDRMVEIVSRDDD